ncbi:uncharacterized protein FOBCDRAFT_242099 [Fusarium oxysporum Fo47]|uniref:uncharacterized protein n=1 Tax=Fusarium oxysporum Fo47 TaxID=660027 RepID=UPI00286987B5|nr:uncharacterized protein FOBCDRAFT_242099 [Fusarium oxysporum Fo47]WJG35866.1 hypothetical protein FOBCDRAFT_242099 [Fusarium oxysporum Fo47]
MEKIITSSDPGRNSCRSLYHQSKLIDPSDNQPGLSIKLDQVSLHNTQRYGYFWVFQNQFIARLLSKRLSSLSMAACRQLSQDIGHTFKAIPASKAVQDPNYDDEPLSRSPWPLWRLILIVVIHHLCAPKLNTQHGCAIKELQDCRIQLQAAVEQNERYESFIVTAFLKMDDMERMVESLRDGWFKASQWCIEGYNIEESQNQIG